MKKSLLLSVLFLGIITSLNAQMVLVFDTNKSSGTTISLPLAGNVSVTVDWGDEKTETFSSTGEKTHTYAAEGVYTVSISGTLTVFGNGAGTYQGADKLVEVTSFGNLGLKSLSGAFNLALNLEKLPDNIPGTVVDLSYLFLRNYNFNGNIGQWDVKNVFRMEGTFALARSFNQDIGIWNVGKVSNMISMFDGATSFNQNIGGWDVGNVRYMNAMFYEATSFNQDIGGWDTGNVTDMYNMFFYATSFNQNIGGWNVSKTTNMNGTFQNATSFNQDIGGWDVGNVTNMFNMFHDATSFNQDIGGWDVGKVTDLRYTFSGARAFNQDIGGWNVGNVTSMHYTFYGARAFNQDLGGWDVSNVTGMINIFKEAGLSTDNYDKLLIGWAKRTLKYLVTFSAGNSQYTGTATDARQSIISKYYWTIIDGGLSETHTDVGEISESGLLVYPNPFTDHIKVSHTLEVSGLVLLNMAGQVVSVSRGNTEILTGQLPDGIYLLRIEIANNPPQVVRLLKKQGSSE